MKAIIVGLLTIMLSLALGTAQASGLSIPNTFTADTPAKAEEVNANFAALVTAINTLQNTVTNLQDTVTSQASTITSQAKTIATLQSQILAVNNSNVMALDPYVSVLTQGDSNGTNGPIVRFTKVNVQIVNGQGSTDTVNGLGNLIIGYDEADSSGREFCTDLFDSDSISCKSNGATWVVTGVKTGSHNLVVGSQNGYSQYGGIVAGYRNTSYSAYASVSGGQTNTAIGGYSSISGGSGNRTFGSYSSVSGGYYNLAIGEDSSISGGHYNFTYGYASSVSGGYTNQANGDESSILGGNTVTLSTTDGTSP